MILFLPSCYRLTLLLCLIINFAFASDKVVISPQPLWLYKVNIDLSKKPSIKTISNGYYLELSDQQINLVNATEYIHYIRHIVNESGVQNASEVSVTFSPLFQQVIYHKINMIRNGALINQLKAGQIKIVQEETDASDFQYNGLKRAFLLLNDVQKEDRIEVAYSIVGFNPVFKNKYSDKIYFSSGTAISNYYRTVIVPENRKLFIRSFNNAPAPIEEMQDNLRVYHWSNPKLKVWQSQPGVPSWFDNYPYISITEYGDWQEVLDWGLNTFKNYQYTLPASLQNKIRKWRLAANGNKDMFANLAIRFVQDEVRYLGLEIGSYTHQPHDPADVYQQRFGDCKDKALLLATILQHENIPAYVALVNTELKEKLSEATPGTNQFDHAIVAIERSLDYLYIDPTVSRQRGELVNIYVPAYGQALIIRKGEFRLRHIDPGFLNETSIVEKLNVAFADTTRLIVTTTYSGGKADNARGSFADISASEIEDNYVQYYTRAFEGIQLFGEIVIVDDSLRNEVKVTESYSIPEIWNTDSNGKQAFTVFARFVYDQIPDPATTFKDGPVAIQFPLETHYTMEINMPETWTFPLEEVHIKNEFYQFDFVPKVIDSHITLRYYFKTFKDHIPLSELSKYRLDYKTIFSILEFELYKKNQGDKSSTAGNNVNWIMICFFLIITATLTIGLRYLNKRSINQPVTEDALWPIGGWLIVLGISLTASALIQIVAFFSNNFFDNSAWAALGEAGGATLQSLTVAELAFSLLWIYSNIALLYWFTHRRDIFPQMFICYIASLLIGKLFIIGLYNAIPYQPEFGNLLSENGVQFAQTCAYALIWITYIVRSERVKSTFINKRKNR